MSRRAFVGTALFFSAVVTALCLLVALPRAACSALLELNALAGVGDFESEGKVSGVGAGWYCIPTTPQAGTFALDDTTSVSGKQSQRISIPGQPNSDGVYAAAILYLAPIGPAYPLKRGDQLRISAYVRTSAVLSNAVPVGWVGLSDGDPAKASAFEKKPVYFLTKDLGPAWNRVEGAIQLPTGATQLSVFLQIQQMGANPAGPVSGTLWVDDVGVSVVGKLVDVPVVLTRQLRLSTMFRTEPDPLSHARKSSFCVLSDPGYVAQFKYFRPDAQLVSWHDMMYTSCVVNGDGTVGYTEPTDPTWLLRDANGAPIAISFGSLVQSHAVDISNADYQRDWVQNAVAQITKQGYDGVCVDHVSEFYYHFGRFGFGPANPVRVLDDKGELVPKFSNSTEWDAARVDFIKNVATGIKSAVPGGKVILNSGCGTDWARYPWSEFVKYVDGIVNECAFYYADDSRVPYTLGNYRGRAYWEQTLRDMALAAAMPRPFVSIVQTRIEENDTAKLRFSLASYLLGAYDSSFFAADSFHCVSWDEYNHVFDSPDYDLRIGTPVSAYRLDQSGVYVRNFTGGLVLVNPDQYASYTYSLTGTYVDLDRRTVRPGAKTLGPLSAMILLSKK